MRLASQTCRVPVAPHRRWTAVPLSAAFVLTLASCSDSKDCTRGNPLMPQCLTVVSQPLPRDPRVVFQSNMHGDVEIYTVNSDGTDLRRLTNSPGIDGAARWSPDGARIVFSSVRSGTGREIWTMNADGSDPRQLTSLGAFSQFPDWSPDGTRIVFQSRRSDGNFDIYVMDSDGGNLQLLRTGNSQSCPRWSPDGTRIAMEWFESTAECPCVALLPGCQCNGRIAIMNADGSGLTLLPQIGSNDSWPDWSPDGRRLLFSSYRPQAPGLPARQQVMVMNVDGTGARTLTTGMMDEWNPVWSRSASRIYFIRGFQVYTANTDGTDPGRVTAHTASDVLVHAR
jgi:Tol biopolymer transport system component